MRLDTLWTNARLLTLAPKAGGRWRPRSTERLRLRASLCMAAPIGSTGSPTVV